jgi:ribosomal protein S18 acetylase RimI-like enzyme
MYGHRHQASSTALDITIRPYCAEDEQGWLRCSVLSFLATAYFDSVYRHKPHYEQPAIELVAEIDGVIVGAIDVECETTPDSVCTVCRTDGSPVLGGMIWHLAVHPDVQRRGIGGRLLREARRLATVQGIACFEAWTRDDAGTLCWYESHGFTWVTRYLHVYMDGEETLDDVARCSIPGLRPVKLFAHYTGDDGEAIRARFDRVHDCNCYRLRF